MQYVNITGTNKAGIHYMTEVTDILLTCHAMNSFTSVQMVSW